MKLIRLLALGMLVAAGAAAGQSYPDKSKQLRIVVPSGAATSIDMLARGLAQGITDVAGLPAIVENKPGADGVIGVQAVKTAPADGYTVLLTNSSTQVLNVHMLAKIPYDPVADFAPLIGVAKTSLVMNAGPSTPFKTVREFIEAAKANPGKYTFGTGTATTRLAGELLKYSAGINMLDVPFKSLADTMIALVAGQIDVVFIDPQSASAFLQAWGASARLYGLDAPGWDAERSHAARRGRA